LTNLRIGLSYAPCRHRQRERPRGTAHRNRRGPCTALATSTRADHDRAHLATVDIYTLVQRTPKVSIGIDATEQAVIIDDDAGIVEEALQGHRFEGFRLDILRMSDNVLGASLLKR